MNKQELLDELNRAWAVLRTESSFSNGIKTGVTLGIRLVEKLDEPAKVVIPQFVADYIELNKGWNGDRQAYTEDNSGLWFALNGDSCGMSNSVSDWLFNEEKVETFARAWLDGYEVEKEKLYIVQLPTNLEDDLIILDADGDIWKDSWPSRYKMTEKRIKEIDERYWPFAVEVAE